MKFTRHLEREGADIFGVDGNCYHLIMTDISVSWPCGKQCEKYNNHLSVTTLHMKERGTLPAHGYFHLSIFAPPSCSPCSSPGDVPPACDPDRAA